MNALAATLPLEQQRQCAVSEVRPSPTGKWLAYTLDTSGYETYDIHVRELGGAYKDDEGLASARDESLAGLGSLSATGGGITWIDDSSFAYLRQDASHRPFQGEHILFSFLFLSSHLLAPHFTSPASRLLAPPLSSVAPSHPHAVAPTASRTSWSGIPSKRRERRLSVVSELSPLPTPERSR